MEKMRDFLKTKWLILLLAGLALVLILIKIFWLPEQRPGTPPPTGGPTLSPQEGLPLPKFVPEEITNRSVDFQFNLSSSPSLPSSLPAYKVLALDEDHFPKTSPDASGPTMISNDKTAVEEAKKVLKEEGVDTTAAIARVSYVATEGLDAFSVPSATEASIFAVDFWLKKDGLTIVSENPSAALYNVWLGKNGKVQKGFAVKFSLGEAKTLTLRSFEKAHEDVLNQKGTVVWLDKKMTEEDVGVTKMTIEKFTINGVSLVYLLPSFLPGYLQPVYLFGGIASLTDGSVVEAAAYLPAVEEKYFAP